MIQCAAAMMSITKLVEGAAHDIFLPQFEDDSMCGCYDEHNKVGRRSRVVMLIIAAAHRIIFKPRQKYIMAIIYTQYQTIYH
jgi:hypothetical protein